MYRQSLNVHAIKSSWIKFLQPCASQLFLRLYIYTYIYEKSMNHKKNNSVGEMTWMLRERVALSEKLS